MPNSVTSVGKGAFRNSKSLQSVKLSENIEIIPTELFAGNSLLHTVNIPKNVLSIEEKAFFNAVSIRSLVLPPSLAIIGNSAMEGLSSISNLDIPDSVRSIGDRGLASNSKLIILSLPHKLAYLGADALVGSSALTTVFYCGNIPGITIKSTCTEAMQKKIDEDIYTEEKSIRDRQRESSSPTPGITNDLAAALNAVMEASLLAVDSAKEAEKIALEVSAAVDKTRGAISEIEILLNAQISALKAQVAAFGSLLTKIAKKVNA